MLNTHHQNKKMSPPRLDSRYFKLLVEKKIPRTDQVAESWACKYPEATAVLFPEQDPTLPICAVTIIPATISEGRGDPPKPRSVLTKRSGAPGKFQVLFSESGIPFKIILTNLTAFPGMSQVKIDILGEDVKVDEPLPKRRLNEANVLKPSESYGVKADFRAGNRQLLVEGIKKKDGGALSVGEDEESSAPLSKHFFINVVGPAECPEIVSLLEGGTSWRPVEQFVRVAKDSGANRGSKKQGRGVGDPRESMSRISRPRTSFLECSVADSDDDMDDDMDESGVDPSPAERLQEIKNIFRRGSVQESSDGMEALAEEARSIVKSLDEHGIDPQVKKNVDVTLDDVSKSQAARIAHGAKVHVETERVSTVFAYDIPGRRMEFGLSVFPGIGEFDTLPEKASILLGDDNIAEILRTYGDKIKSQIGAVFVEEECVVCYGAVPDKIAVRCGHQCVCGDCLGNPAYKKNVCPMCRGVVIGYADAFV